MTTLARWQATITDQSGNIKAGASIEVRTDAGGMGLSSLFSDRAGAVPIGNPFTADSNGFASFYVAGGAYRVRAYTGPSGAPTSEQIWDFVAIGTSRELDYSTDVTMGGGSPSDSLVPTQAAVKSYVTAVGAAQPLQSLLGGII